TRSWSSDPTRSACAPAFSWARGGPVSSDVGARIAARVRAFGEEHYPDAEFDRLAREVFARQYESCAPYRAFCERRGRKPSSVAHWTEIPAAPQSAFKSAALYADE